MALVTFCVPTLWRDTLEQALDSLEDQTDEGFSCMVMGDGEGDHQPRDDRFHFAWYEPVGSAGLTRNAAIRMARSVCPSEWIAFLDDDDELEPEYVEHLRQHNEQAQPDVIIFRMFHPRFGILPHPTMPMLEHGCVGISFAVRDTFLPDEPFISENLDRPGVGGNEDITLIKRLQEMGAKILISPHVDYLVRPGRHV